MINRIYEIQEGYHIDLERVIAVRQFVDIEGQGRSRRRKCWIEIYTDSDQIIVVDCVDIDSLQDTYNMIVNAWQAYANDIEPCYRFEN